MAKALKIFIILQMLISIAALTLGILLFMQREILKIRTRNLEDGAQAFANSIRFAEFQKDRVVVRTREDLPTQREALQELAAKGQEQWQLLQDTIQTLGETKRELKETKEVLEATKAKLNDALDRIDQLTEDLNEAETKLGQAKTRITELDGEVANLHTELATLKDNFAVLEQERDELQVDFDGCQKELNICLDIEEIGATGKVLLVSPEWNFVVLDIGKEMHVVPDREMLIHRGDELVGRVRITTVEPRICVAEILPGAKAHNIKAGDYAIAPEG